VETGITCRRSERAAEAGGAQEAARGARDLKKAYRRVYRPLLLPLRLHVPYWTLDLVRAGYRLFRRVFPDRA
jgi:hypothetical protein